MSLIFLTNKTVFITFQNLILNPRLQTLISILSLQVQEKTLQIFGKSVPDVPDVCPNTFFWKGWDYLPKKSIGFLGFY